MAKETAQQRAAREAEARRKANAEREAAERRRDQEQRAARAQAEEQRKKANAEREAADRKREAEQRAQKQAEAQKKTPSGAMAKDPAPVQDMARVQQRLDWLKKNRPNDPEVKQLQARIKATPTQPQQPQQPGVEQPAGPAQPELPPINMDVPQGAQPVSNEYMSQLPSMPGNEAFQPPPGSLYTPQEPQPYGQYQDTPLNQQNWGQQFGSMNYNANQGLMQQMQYAQQQGAFNPGSFQEQMDKAYNNVMSQFERTTQEQFAREQKDFQQMAAERGLDPNGEAYKALQKQVFDRQDMARQNAMSSAQQAAQGVQAQAYGQATNTYQMPFQQMQAFNPMYQSQAGMQSQMQGQQFQLGSQREANMWNAAQTQAGWQQQERMQGIQYGQQQEMFRMQADEEARANARAQQYAKELAQMGYSQQQAQQAAEFERQKTLAAIGQRYQQANIRLQASVTPRGGGGGGGGTNPFEAYMAQQNMNAYNQQPQQQRPSTGNSFLTGAAQGAGASITGAMIK